MRALMYADWCAAKRGFVRNLVVALLVVVPIVFSANEGGELSPGVLVATMVVIMIVYYNLFGLFAPDEQNGWERVRLTLPVSARQVVRARYAFIAAMGAASAVLAVLVGKLSELALLASGGALNVPRGLGVIALAACVTVLSMMALLSLELPIVFRFGMTKGRIAFAIPFILSMLVAFEPVRKLFQDVGDVFLLLSEALGSPTLAIVAAAAAVVALYLLSMRLSEHLYAARDF